jgi:hypothetical protein
VTKNGVAGINRFSQPMTAGQGISVEIKRNGQVTTRLNPSFTFQGGADRPNFSMCYFILMRDELINRLLDQVLLGFCFLSFLSLVGFLFGYLGLRIYLMLNVHGWPCSGEEVKGY